MNKVWNHHLRSSELTYEGTFWVDDFPFLKVGYVTSLEGSKKKR